MAVRSARKCFALLHQIIVRLNDGGVLLEQGVAFLEEGFPLLEDCAAIGPKRFMIL